MTPSSPLPNGDLVWQTLLRCHPHGYVPIGQGRILVNLRGGDLCTIDVATGRPLEAHEIGARYHRTSVLAGDLILIVSRDPKAGGKYGRGVLTANRREG